MLPEKPDYTIIISSSFIQTLHSSNHDVTTTIPAPRCKGYDTVALNILSSRHPVIFHFQYIAWRNLLNVVKISHKDRKSTRLNSSHANISYAVFCLKKKKKTNY